MECIKTLHRRSFHNGGHIHGETKCGCFCCGAMYTGAKILSWIRDPRGEQYEITSRCPYCGVDSVLYEDDEVRITEELLDAMGEYWFGGAAKDGRKIVKKNRETMKEE